VCGSEAAASHPGRNLGVRLCPVQVVPLYDECRKRVVALDVCQFGLVELGPPSVNILHKNFAAGHDYDSYPKVICKFIHELATPLDTTRVFKISQLSVKSKIVLCTRTKCETIIYARDCNMGKQCAIRAWIVLRSFELSSAAKTPRRERRRVFFDHDDDHILGPCTADALREVGARGTAPFARSSCSRQYSLHPHPGGRIFVQASACAVEST
jgi:hypothetical protein